MIYFSDFDTGGGGASYGTHQYWRVIAFNVWSASWTEAGEVEFLDSTGTLIPATGGSPIVSSGNGANAFDSVVSSKWQATFNAVTNQWVGYNFPSTKSVAKVRISNTTFRDCALQYSDDGSTWTTAFAFHNLMDNQNKTTAVTFPLAALATGYHYYWRIFCVDSNSGLLALGEIEFRATSGGADQIPTMTTNIGTGAAAFASSIYGSGSEAWRAFADNGNASGWMASSNTNQFCGAEVSAGLKVEEVALTAAYFDPVRTAKNMRLDWSDDYTNWTTQKTFAAQTGWSAGETRVLSAI